MSEDYMRDEFQEEEEPSEESLEEVVASELEKTVLHPTDWTVETILNQIARARIDLNPRFQRREAWRDDRKSRFIESVILGFPIPQIVLAEVPRKKGSYVIIDGKQRLLSLIQFARGAENFIEIEGFRELRLQGLHVLTDLNRKYARDLQHDPRWQDYWTQFENRTIRTIVIRGWEDDTILYHIFLRLNTGSVQLSPQELRNALYPGQFAEFLDEYSGKSPALRKILKRREPDFRMRDAELLLRYYAFRVFLEQYQGSMKRFLDTTIDRLNKCWERKCTDDKVLQGYTSGEEAVRKMAEQFEYAVELTYAVFGDDAFQLWKQGEFVGRFNRAIFDVMLYHFWRDEVRKVLQSKSRRGAVKDAFVELCESRPDFIDATEVTTKSIQAVTTRLSLWTQKLKEVLGTDLPTPRLVKGESGRRRIEVK